MSKQEEFHRPENPVEKTRGIDSKAMETEMKRKFNRNQK